jgi:hypothetical protein
MNFLVNLYDDAGQLIWEGHAEDFLGFNENDEELELLLLSLCAEGDEGIYGGGAAPEFLVRRVAE